MEIYLFTKNQKYFRKFAYFSNEEFFPYIEDDMEDDIEDAKESIEIKTLREAIGCCDYNFFYDEDEDTEGLGPYDFSEKYPNGKS